MLDRFKEVVHAEYPFILKGDLYLAISGGKDSMVLLDLLRKSGLNPTLLHCNFQLRGLESDQDEAFLANFAFENKLDIHVRKFDTEKFAQKRGKTIQETARELRYEWFDSFLIKENSYLLTAHHLDDSIETFFINLLRGTGLKGLGGIPEINKKTVRPLSRFSTEDIYTYIDQNNINYRKDSSNSSNKYLRNRLRNEILPQFLELEPNFKSKMRKTLDDVRNTIDWVRREIERIKEKFFIKNEDGFQVELEMVRNQSPTLLVQLFADFDLHRSQISSFIHFLESQTGSQFTTKTHTFLLDRSSLLIVESAKQREGSIHVPIENLPFSYAIESGKIEFSERSDFEIIKDGTVQQVQFSSLDFPLTLRNWRAGDRIIPLGMFGSKLVSDILIDKKVNQFEKADILVLENADGRLVLILGLVISEEFKIIADTRSILEIRC